MQWLENLLGPPAPPKPAPVYRPPTALDIIERELQRLHSELDDYKDQMEYCGDGDKGYLRLLDSLDKLNGELVRRSQEESKLAGS